MIRYKFKIVFKKVTFIFSATMRVYQDFFIYQSGIYRHSRSAELHDSGYHSVRIIGWGEEPSYRGPPLKYWVSLQHIKVIR